MVLKEINNTSRIQNFKHIDFRITSSTITGESNMLLRVKGAMVITIFIPLVIIRVTAITIIVVNTTSNHNTNDKDSTSTS